MRKFLKKIKDKFIKHAEWWRNYLTGISVFIISLGTTYYVDSLLEKYKEKKNDIEAMNMVKTELESNLKELKDIEEYYLQEIRFSKALSYEGISYEETKKDSINEFNNQHRTYYYCLLKNYAFNMTKEYGLMQRMDKTLLVSLFECYEQLDVVKDMSMYYREKRIQQLSDFASSLPKGGYGETTFEQWKQIYKNKKFHTYLVISIPVGANPIIHIEKSTQKLIEELIICIDEIYLLN